MKYILAIVIALLSYSIGCAQRKRPNALAKHYLVKGYLPQAANSTVYLFQQIYTNSHIITDSTKADDHGRFSFTGHVDEPSIGQIIVNQPILNKYFSLENSVISITTDSANTIKVEGSKEDTALRQFIKMSDSPLFNQIREQADAAVQEALNKNDTIAISNTQRHRDTVSQQIKTAVVGFINRYPFYTIAVRTVILLMEDEANRPAADSLLSAFKSRHVSPGQVAFLQERLNKLRLLTAGKPAPEFTQQDTSGRWFSLSSQRGRYVYVDFWSSWCVPCRQANPALVALSKKFQEKNLTIISVSLDSDRKQWLQAIRRDKLNQKNWLHLSDLKTWNNAVAVKYAVGSIPKRFLIDPQGIIIAVDLKEAALENMLQTLLNQ